MGKLTLGHFSCFITLVDNEGDVEKSAINLDVTPALLRQRIRSFEDEIAGRSLFDRDSGRFVLNDVGKPYYKETKQLEEISKNLAGIVGRRLKRLENERKARFYVPDYLANTETFTSNFQRVSRIEHETENVFCEVTESCQDDDSLGTAKSLDTSMAVRIDERDREDKKGGRGSQIEYIGKVDLYVYYSKDEGPDFPQGPLRLEDLVKHKHISLSPGNYPYHDKVVGKLIKGIKPEYADNFQSALTAIVGTPKIFLSCPLSVKPAGIVERKIEDVSFDVTLTGTNPAMDKESRDLVSRIASLFRGEEVNPPPVPPAPSPASRTT